jgi:predicted translin family RNA/ssDNA-binding protein
MNKQQFDAEFSALSDKLSSLLARYPRALDAMYKADKGEQLSDAIKHYENLIDDEMRIRQQIGAIHAKYINYLDDIIDAANRRAVKNTVSKQAIRRTYA